MGEARDRASGALRLLCEAAVVVAFGVAACGHASPGSGAAPSEATVTRTTQAGTEVVLPAPLVAHHGALVAQVLDRLDAAAPDPDPRIPTGTRGVPPGWRVVVRQSGAFPVSGPAPGFALGSADLTGRRLWLALSDRSPAGALLPALEHELRHAYTGDAAAGH